jgi:dimethylglycine dehydrogenase
MSSGIKTKLAYLIFDDQVPAECFGNEAVFSDGELTGIITSGAYGYRVGHSIAFAYLKTKHCNDGVNLTVETSLGSRSCHVSMNASYDQNNEKLCS